MSRDASKSVKGISVGDTGKANKGFEVTESGYPDKCMQHITDVAMLNKGPNTSSNKCNEKNNADARMDDAISKADACEIYDSKKDEELEADDSSKMVIEVGVGLGNTIETNGGMKVAESEEAIEMYRDAAKSVKGISVAESDEASGEFGDTSKANKGIKVTESGYSDKCKEHISYIAVLNKGPTTSSNKCNEGYDSKKRELEADDGSKMVMELGVGLANIVQSYGGIDVAESEEAIDVFRDAAKSVDGISAAELDEASAASGDTGKTEKVIKVLASGEASMESRYPDKSMGDLDVAARNKEPTTSSNKCNEKKNNAGYVVSETAACSDRVVREKEGTVKADSGSSKAEKEGKSIGIALPERLKGTEEVMGSTPIPDVFRDIGVKRSEGYEEATGSMAVPGTVWETSGAKLWITGIRRRTSGTTLKPGNWSWSSGGSSTDARKKFIEHFCRKS